MNEQYGQLIEPPAVSFSFGAPGWYLLGVLLLLVIGCIAWLAYRYYKHNAYRRRSLAWLEQQKANPDKLSLLYDTNMLLKRIALSKYGRQRVAAVRGSEWVALLNGSLHRELFDYKDQELLQNGLYASKEQNADPGAVDDFVQKAKFWILKHRKNIILTSKSFNN